MDSLNTFVEANPIAPVVQSGVAEIQTVQKDDLKLICWLALC
jgi:hypothetical protein